MQQRPVDQLGHDVEHIELRDSLSAGNGSGTEQIEAGRENRESIEHGPLDVGAQVVGPVECASHRLMPLHPRASTSDQ